MFAINFLFLIFVLSRKNVLPRARTYLLTLTFLFSGSPRRSSHAERTASCVCGRTELVRKEAKLASRKKVKQSPYGLRTATNSLHNPGTGRRRRIERKRRSSSHIKIFFFFFGGSSEILVASSFFFSLDLGRDRYRLLKLCIIYFLIWTYVQWSLPKECSLITWSLGKRSYVGMCFEVLPAVIMKNINSPAKVGD